ncbi:phospholipid-binding lipoprotein MlaA [Poseidonocella pacifica]|uniref:Phospholipid-binding lipoprotein MlaA n=1 Tax=Poseidonocella pacifica TaxID=871651 RepID=A0A1I0Y0C6_9RHOB|nr:VacJ family lipoprotein [Poseidonocella pacifica]SFB06594.1 phospholipid-binding lipoprotein MlaA [Poseidonocella pacifica]
MHPSPFPLLRRICAGASLLLLAACATPPDGVDRYEDANRRHFALNQRLDRIFLEPAARGYSETVPGPAKAAVRNFASNVGLPGVVVNNVAQGDLPGAGRNSLRFVVNTVLGIAGIFDPATPMGLAEKRTDFGTTLHVWGVGEGDFLVLPVMGPTTERDAAGRIVDLFTNPLKPLLPVGTRRAVGAFRFADGVSRKRDAALARGLVIESYEDMRAGALARRRGQLGEGRSP